MSAFVETALGMILIFLFTSLIVTAVQEVFAAFFALRAKALESAIKALLDGRGATTVFDQFKANPLIQALYDANGSRPSYIPARSFALSVMNLARPAGPAAVTLANVQAWAAKPGAGRIGPIVTDLITTATATEADLQKSLESWYDETMDRLSGWYKRWTQVSTIVFGLLAAFAFNIDSVAVWDALTSQPQLRAAAANYASTLAKTNDPPKYDVMVKDLQALKLPIGWKNENGEYDFGKFLPERGRVLGSEFFKSLNWMMLLGWVIAALAASLGSAFWFDLLKRFVQIRGAGPKPGVAEPTADPAGSPIPGGPMLAMATKARPALLRDRA
jgi:hypothetical protein